MNSLKPLIYFSIFKYPLKSEEIFNFSSSKDIEIVENELSQLVKKKIIHKVGDYYLFENEKEIIERREKGNKMAKKALKKAKKMANFISKFPFVKGVGISGSLSKGYYDEDSDIDYFIITENHRLWIARTILILFKKVFLLNSKKYFCVNYFLSISSLEIKEKNRFTATELTTLIPMRGKDEFKKFFKENDWFLKFFPNISISTSEIDEIKKPLIIKAFQTIFKGSLGNKLDDFFLKITLKKWKSKFKGYDTNDFKVALRSTKGVSKHHPNNYQKKVIDRLNGKYEEFETKFNITLPREHA